MFTPLQGDWCLSVLITLTLEKVNPLQAESKDVTLVIQAIHRIREDAFSALLPPCHASRVEMEMFPILSSIPQKSWHKEQQKLEEIFNYARPFLLLC